jgi:hypothetical protein
MIPTFHDGLLTGIHMEDGFATLSIRRVDGTRWLVQMEGVEHLLATEFRQGNIISNFEVIAGLAPSRAWLEELLPAPHQNVAQTYHDRHREVLDRLGERIAGGDLNLVVVSPSYGCDLLATCCRVSASELEPAAAKTI